MNEITTVELLGMNIGQERLELREKLAIASKEVVISPVVRAACLHEKFVPEID